jgi:hypothetical protein
LLTRARKPHAHRGVAGRRVVPPHAQAAVRESHDNVPVAVVVEVAERHGLERGAFSRRQRAEPGRPGRLHPAAAADVAVQPGAVGRQGQQVQETVVVVVHQLCGDRSPRVVRGGADAKPAPAVAEGEHTRPIGEAQEDVGEAVLVDIPDRQGGIVAGRRQPGFGRGVAERAVPHVPEERGRAPGGGQEDVDVAAVVEIDRCDSTGASELYGQACVGGDVGERAVAVVAQQLDRGPGQDDVEVAVVVHVGERRRGGGRDAGGQRLRGHVLERAVGCLPKERVAPSPEHQQVRLAVVVVVARDRADGILDAGLRQPRGLLRVAAPLVAEKAQPARARDEHVQGAVAVRIEQRHSSGWS